MRFPGLSKNSVVLMLESWTVGVLGWGEGGMCGPPRHVWCDAFGVRERNSRIFKDRVHYAKSQAFYFWRLHEWGLKSFTLSTYSLMDFLETINLCNYYYGWFRLFPFLFLFCFAVLLWFVYVLYTLFWFLINCNYLSKKKKKRLVWFSLTTYTKRDQL